MADLDPADRAITAADFVAMAAIRNALALHSRGVDRADAALIAGAYHDDATVDYGFFTGPAAALATILADAQTNTPPTLHRTGNIDIRLHGDRAVSEAYVVAYVEEAAQQRLVFGRYLDRHQCRDGVWRIVHRTYVLDSNVNRPNTATHAPASPDLAHFAPWGGKGAADAGRALLALHAANAGSLKDTPAMTTDTALADALSREAILRLVAGYCRGVDRGDADLLATLFWADASVVSGVVNGTGPEFAQGIVTFVTTHLEASFHAVGNAWIEVSGDHAVGEHYVIAHARGTGFSTLTGGRYVDRYERRGGEWRIASRTFVCDWNSNAPVSFDPGGFYAALTTRGCFGPADPVHALWASLPRTTTAPALQA